MTYAYVVQPDSTVALRNIVVGTTEGDVTTIESGLSPNDVVVIDGVDKLQKGSKVATREQKAAVTVGGATPQATGSVESAKKGS